MKRAAVPDVPHRIHVSSDRVVLELGHDHYALTDAEAIELADLLVDATEKLTSRMERRS
ncbi:hypothetical protein ACFWCF_24815 [Rhodococcus sp. NPDC060090]|uniref:hypothetical protein n=1 Tax=Rhodococcus sp. NPDC060090 TaxID=3347056 RepID=UPI0036657574